MNERPIGVLFVCLGNICRSPLARALFTQRVIEAGMAERFDIDSCGTSAYHAGGGADERSCEVARKFAVPMEHTARCLDPEADFKRFEWLIAMDRANQRNLLAAGARPERVHLMRAFDPAYARDPGNAPDVPDPYHGGPAGFDRMYEMLDRATRGLLARVS